MDWRKIIGNKNLKKYVEVVLNKDKVKVFIRNVPNWKYYHSRFEIYPLDGLCGLDKGEIIISYEGASIFSSGFNAPNLIFFVAGNKLLC